MISINPEERGSKFIRNVGFLLFQQVQYVRDSTINTNSHENHKSGMGSTDGNKLGNLSAGAHQGN
jgi:hypothetical protein